MKTNDKKLIAEAIQIIKESNSIFYSQEMAKTLVQKAWDQVNYQMPVNKGKKLLNILGLFCS